MNTKTVGHTAVEVEVINVRKISAPKSIQKAIVDVRFFDGLIVKGFSVCKGNGGTFVSAPRKVSKDGRWFDVLEFSEELKQEIQDKVLKSYEAED